MDLFVGAQLPADQLEAISLGLSTNSTGMVSTSGGVGLHRGPLQGHSMSRRGGETGDLTNLGNMPGDDGDHARSSLNADIPGGVYPFRVETGSTTFDDLPTENPTVYEGASPGISLPMTWFIDEGFLPTGLPGVPEDEMQRRVRVARRLLTEPPTDPNLYPVRRKRQRRVSLRPGLSADEKARISNRESAERKRTREAEHRDFCMGKVAEGQALTAYLRAQVALAGGDPFEFDKLPTSFTSQFMVPIRATAPMVGQKNSREATQQETP